MKLDCSTPDFSRTKALLAETIIEMAGSVPMQKITVFNSYPPHEGGTRRCGGNKSTR